MRHEPVGVLRAVIAGSAAIRTSGRKLAMTGSSSALSSISAKPRPPRAISTAGEIQPAMDDPLIAKKHTYWESNGQVTRRIRIG